jgi:fructose-bisphosphate aldolase class II
VTLDRASGLVAAAARQGTAVFAFNVITLEHAEAVVAGATRAGLGVILQVSQNAVAFHGGNVRPLLAACREIADAAAVPIALHLDHVDDPRLIDAGIAASAEVGLGSIMVDFSRLDGPANIAATARATRDAHAAGLWVEGELGEIGGKDGAHAPGVRTDPDEARRFVADTGIDALAVAVGSSHAMRDRSATIDHELVSRLAAAAGVPLVLHGSSGVADAELARAIAAGIRKVNVGTALNIAAMTATREALRADPALVDPRPMARSARDAMADVVADLTAIAR